MASDFNEDLIIKQIQALNDTNKFYDILSLISNSNTSHLHLHNTTEVFSEEVAIFLSQSVLSNGINLCPWSLSQIVMNV